MGTTIETFSLKCPAFVVAGVLAERRVHAQVPRGNEYEGETSGRAYTPLTKETKIPTKETFIPLSTTPTR